MKNTIDFSPVQLGAPSASLQDIAAYLRGVADATAALGLSGPPVEAPLTVPSPPPPVYPVSISSHGPMSRRTVPYGLETSSNEPARRDTMAYPSPEAPAYAVSAVVDGILDAWDNEDAPERTSGVCLRADRLSAEWYELVDAGVA